MLGRIQVLHMGGSVSDRQGHAPRGNFEIYPLRNAIYSVLRANLSRFKIALKSS